MYVWVNIYIYVYLSISLYLFICLFLHQSMSITQHTRRVLFPQAPFDYVVDGPNVGYANQNFEGGRFEFTQVGNTDRYISISFDL